MRFKTKLIIIILFIFISTPSIAKNTAQDKPILAFSVVSDIHSNSSKFHNALIDLHNINSKLDVLILNGDTVDKGIKSHYDKMKDAINKDKKLLPQKVIINIGNHEFFTQSIFKLTDTNSSIKQYLSFSGEKNVYHDTWIKGYHFISLGSEKTNIPPMESNIQAYLSNSQLKWLETKLKEKYEPNKPIFVFLHQPLNCSVKGTYDNEFNSNAIMQNKSLKNILSRYPNIIFFSSHTHNMLNPYEGCIKQKFTICDTSSVASPIDTENRYTDNSEGIYVEVYNNAVVIRGRDFKNKKWINIYRLNIKSKSLSSKI